MYTETQLYSFLTFGIGVHTRRTVISTHSVRYIESKVEGKVIDQKKSPQTKEDTGGEIRSTFTLPTCSFWHARGIGEVNRSSRWSRISMAGASLLREASVPLKSWALTWFGTSTFSKTTFQS